MRLMVARKLVLLSATAVFLLSAVAATAAEPARVRLEPFTETGAAEAGPKPDWLMQAINQSVADELSSMKDVTVVGSPAPAGEPQGQPATQPAADYTVRGTIQRINQQVRVTGSVLDASGKTVGGFKATGSEQELFGIEDSIAQQLRTTLGIAEQPASLAPPLASGAQTTPPPQPLGSSYDGSDLQRAVQDPSYTRRLSDRSYWNNATVPAGVVAPNYPPTYGVGGGYYPPYYTGGWGWGGWGLGGPTVIVVNNGKDRDHHDHHDHDRGSSGPGIIIPDTNGQAIRSAATGAGGNIMRQPQLVPSGGPQLVPSGGPQFVPSGGPQLVPGNPVPPGMSGSSSGNNAPKGAGVNMGGSHAPGAGYSSGGSNAPGAGHR